MSHKEEVTEEKVGLQKNLLYLLRDIAVALVAIIIVLQFIKPTIVFEHSMENTLHPDDYVFLAKQAYTFGEIEFADIVVFESDLVDERGTQKNLIKRVIGLPGDVISINNDMVYRNGQSLDEPYTKDGVTLGEMAPVTVPQDAYFMLGDNRAVSKDSRDVTVGFVPKKNIKGKVLFRLFPLSSAGSLY